MAEQNEESGVRLGPDQEPDGGSLEPLDDGKCMEDKSYAVFRNLKKSHDCIINTGRGINNG
uniref:Uncharacterized protein n=1 Tax=Magallana gigas TaxID=29159 RepID=K1QN15_MAGGI